MKSSLFGTSVKGQAIIAYHFMGSGPNVLILGGVHGNEPEGVYCAHGLLREWSKGYTHRLNVTLVPNFNPDGVLQQSRVNANGVDLNRNLPTNDWNPSAFNKKYPPGPFPNSEPENQALVKFLSVNKPKLIISLHSWYPVLNVNGSCKEEAAVIAKWTGYKIDEHIGYPTPGCLGTYAGLERDMPTLTYEIERGLDPSKITSLHVTAIREALKVTEIIRR